MTLRQRYSLLACVSTLTFVVPPVAHAQAAAEAPSADETAPPEIIVTARRRDERLQDVPISITALQGSELARQQITDVNALRGRIPGLTVTVSPGGGRNAPIFAIRGQSQTEVAGVSDPSVSLYVNDVPVPRPHGANLAFFDIASLEVAKGPQGTLFGRNTTGGAILIRTQQPVDQFEAYLQQTIGNYGTSISEGAVNVPISDIAALRIAGIYSHKDGYITDVITDRDVNYSNQRAIRGSLKIAPTDGLTTTFIASFSRARDGGTGGYAYYAGNPLFAPGVTDQESRDIYDIASGLPSFNRVKVWSAENHTSYELNDNFTLKNIVAYRELKLHSLDDEDGSANQVFHIERFVKQHQISEELQLQATFDRFDFIVGGFFFTEKMDDQALSAGSLVIAGTQDPGLIEPANLTGFFPRYSRTYIKPENTSYAAFAQGTYRVTDALSLTAGIRLNHDVRKFVALSTGLQPAIDDTAQTCRFTLDEDGDPNTPETRPTLANCRFSAEKSFTEPTYNLSIDFKPREGMLLYAAHRHGYRTGGYSARTSAQATLSKVFKPEIVDDFEVGVKADWRVNGMFLRTNLAAYTGNYKDMQRLLTVQLSPPITETTNAAKARIRGIEFEALFRPIPLIELSGYYNYTDAKFKKYISPVGEDFTPQIYPRAPRNMYGATLQLNLPTPPSTGDISAAISFNHIDKYDNNDGYQIETNAAGDPIPAAIAANRAQIVPGYTLWNANVEWREIFGSGVTVTAFVDNLADKKYSLPFDGTSGLYESRVAGAPRTFGMRARVDF